MSKRLSFSIAVNLLTENFKKGTNTVKNSLRSMQMQVLTFAAALGAGGLGISGLISRFKDVARETSRVLTALKNVSDGTKGFADNLRFINDLAKKYGLEVNALTGNFAKFTASATQANMPMEQQKKVFESVSRAITAFGLSASESDGVMLALSQMMSKGKISMEELRKQMGEKLPVAIQAMAKALGVSIGEMEKLIGTGKVMSADVLPKFADALNEIIPNVDTDNLETSLSRLSNAFGEIVNSSGFQDKYKALIDGLTSLLQSAAQNVKNIIVTIVAGIAFFIGNSLQKTYLKYVNNGKQIIANEETASRKMRASVQSYTEAKKRLSDLELQHAQANGQKQITLAKRIEEAKLQVQGRAAVARQSIADRVAAHEATVNVRTYGKLGTLGAMVVGTAKKIGLAIKSMFSMFAFGAILSGITAIIGHFVNLYTEAKRIKNIFSEYKKEAESVGNTQEVKMLQTQLAIMNDKTRSQKEINAAQATLQQMLGKEKLSQADINKEVAKRIELLKEAARADYFANKAVEVENKIQGKANEVGISDEELTLLARYKSSSSKNGQANYWERLNKAAGITSKNVTFKQVGLRKRIMEAVNETVEDLRVLDDANKRLENAATRGNELTTTSPTVDDPDKNKENLLKKKLEAEQWLENKRKELENESERNRLEYEQKQLDLEEEGFNKRFKQIKLNHQKELLAIREFQTEKEKEQIEAAKRIYVSENGGSDKGFDFPKFDKSKLPAGLRPDDIQTEVISRDVQSTKQQEKDTADLLRSMLDKYKDYNEQRKEINKQYSDDEATLNALRNAENAKAIDAALAELKKARERAIKEINDSEAKEYMKSTDLFVELFEDASRKSVSELKSIIDKANELKKVLKDSSAEIPEWFVDSQIKNKDSLNHEQLKQARDAIRAYIEELKKDPKAIKDFEDAIASLYGTMGNVSPVAKFSDSINKAIENIKKGGIKNIGAGIEGIGNATQEIMPHLQKFGDDMRSIFGDGVGDSIDGFLKSVESLSEIGAGTGKLMQGDLTGILDIASGFGKIFGHASKVNKEHREALRLLRLQAEEQKHLYKIEKLREALASESTNTIYGSDEWGKAANATKVYHDAVKELDESLRKLEDVDVVTGSRKSGWGFWKKRKDVWSDLLTTFPELIDANGKFDKTLAETILSTRKLSDEGKMAIQQAIENAEVVEEAFSELKDYLSGLFSDLGQNMMSAFTDAFKGSKSAISDFVDSASGMLGKLVEDFIYSMRLAPIIEKASKEAENMMLNNKLTEEQKNQKLIDITGNLIDDILRQQNYVFADLEKWGKVIKEETGKNPFVNDTTQDSTKGHSVSMDQDTGGAILGRVTGLHETNLRMESLLSDIKSDVTSSFTQIAGVGEELRKHTGIFDEMKQVQRKTFFRIDKITEGMSALNDMNAKLINIEKNTKGLVTK